MDSLTRTAQSAVKSWYDVLTRMGGSNLQDRNKLLVLWFFHELKNRGDFLSVPTIVRDEEGKVAGCHWDIDRELERDLEKRYRCNLPCLTESSCFIKVLPDDNCIPVAKIFWEDTAGRNLLLLVANATDKGRKIGDIDYNDVESIANAYEWTEDSALFHPNDSEEKSYDPILGLNEQ